MRNKIKEAVDQLSGMPLYSVFIHAVALSESVPNGWAAGIEMYTDFSETQKAEIAAQEWQSVVALERLRDENEG